MHTALGVMNRDISDSETDDRAALAALAARHGCRIGEVIVVDHNTYMPTTLITHTAHTIGATAILAPGLAHLGTAAKALTLACTLLVPENVIERTPGWTPNP
ncbi:hypothetical protein IU449_09560 [Nocardia higoensis]|uniref:Uncharacterized protein n=1 Tax=Nocardia higoensis TaxID=228599 RepID=A0ABS0D8I7_9NOCA|nr:hypothetical protein [Nocardia higoensis]MBF6354787.1 hypothetical protein [Nocardia higoensis]